MTFLAFALAAVTLQDGFRSDAAAAPVVDGGQTRGVAWNDLDGDGRPDLALANIGPTGAVWIYRNRPAGLQRMRPVALDQHMQAEGVTLADMDNDGRPDLLVARTDGPPLLFWNRGGFRFEQDHRAFAGVTVPSSMLCVADFDRDGRLDVVVVTRDAQPDILLHNTRQGLRAVPGALSDYAADGRTCAVGDLDDDGLPDLYVGNFVVPGSNPPQDATDQLFRNLGGLRFAMQQDSPVTQNPSRTYGASFTDWDEDGFDDLLVTNIGRTDRNVLYRNVRGSLQSAGLAAFDRATGPSKGHAWGDYDNDGDLDLYIAQGTEGLRPDSEFNVRNVLYENRGGTLVRVLRGVAVQDEHISAGVAQADMDIDGDLDLFVGNWGGDGEVNSLYVNQIGGRSVAIALRGTQSNRQGIGAHLELTVRRGDQLIARRAALWPQTGYGSMNEPVVHFGLPTGDRPVALDIRWPSGARQHVPVGEIGRYRVTERGPVARLSSR